MSEYRTLLRALFDAAVSAAHPAAILARHLPEPPASGRIVLLAAGKAAGSMVEAGEAFYLDERGVTRERLGGIAVARRGYCRPTRCVPCIEAGHPVPDEKGMAAAAEALELASSAGPDDLVLALVSGGGSANWVLPVEGVSLEDKQAVTRALLRAGANIGEINTVRKHLSRIKGGRLAAAAAPAPIVTLAISDVPHDDPSVIASGPTVADRSTLEGARDVLSSYRIQPPDSVRRALESDANETPKPGDERLAGASFEIISRPADAVAAAETEARRAGYEPIVLGADLEGEAREVAARHAAQAREIAGRGGRAAIISGGELTVTIRGDGRGGPNQEYALALALALEGSEGIWGLAGDTDGTDGGGGEPSDPAGAFVAPDTLERARARGLDPAQFLDQNDATGFFEQIDDLLLTGPTFTNVNDLRVVLIDSDARGAAQSS